ncbi:hypothetical protein SY83_22225 [Paenibacillus swuensis]|uniref:MFS transporter n=1 Tax=Paenibacillus swuensis TaxID=1178515 RepID=A0A172TQ65_9BACL|nr:MFS transporter [Paenibacillus swuensis]ANE49116.1 hypothetical protein SY83_22225 [Paenibacillus swuensis]
MRVTNFTPKREGSAVFKRWRDSVAAGLPPEKLLSRDAKTVLALHCFYNIGTAMAGVFLNLYLWRLTNDLFVNGMYNIIIFSVTPIFFVICGYWAKTKDRLLVFRLGILFTALFYLAVILAQEHVADYAYGFGVLNGIATGFYWLGYLTLQFDMSTQLNRVRFLGFNLIMVNTANLIGPALAGFIIANSTGLSGYTVVFTIAFIMFLIASVGSLKLHAHPSHHKTYYIKYTFLMLRKSKDWGKILVAWFIFGLFNGTMLFIPNILLLQVFGKEDSVGYIGILFTGITIITSYLYSQKANASSERWYAGFTSIFYAVGASILFWNVTVWTVVAFMIVYAVCFPIQFNFMSAHNFRTIGSMPLKGGFRVEAIAIREIALSFGRVIAMFAVIILADDLYAGTLPVLLLIGALSQALIIFLLNKED